MGSYGLDRELIQVSPEPPVNAAYKRLLRSRVVLLSLFVTAAFTGGYELCASHKSSALAEVRCGADGFHQCVVKAGFLPSLGSGIEQRVIVLVDAI